MPTSDVTSEDTLELELSEEQMFSLSRASAAIQPHTLPIEAANPIETAKKSVPALPALRRGEWPAVIFGIAAMSVFSGGLVYLATSPTGPSQVRQLNRALVAPAPAAETPPPPTADAVRVKFTNPFDASEVFEFPPNTSEAQAREAVARTLLQRAQERKNAARATRQRKKSDDSVAPLRVAAQ